MTNDQPQTAPTTKSGTSGTKRKRRTKAEMEADRKVTAKSKGNPKFKMPSEDEFAQFAPVTDEDLELERSLDEIAKSRPAIDQGPAMELKPEKVNINHLREYIEDYAPASTHPELLEQVHLAKANECDSIDATATLVKQTFRKDFDHIQDKTGYGIFHDIKVYIDGYFEKNKNVDKLSIDQKLHGIK